MKKNTFILRGGILVLLALLSLNKANSQCFATTGMSSILLSSSTSIRDNGSLFHNLSSIVYDTLQYGIFDIKNAVTAISKTTLLESDGFGESFYYTEKLPNGNLKVRYTFNKTVPPNPLFITHTYLIEALPSGEFALDMQAAMPPFSVYFDTSSISLTYTGDKLILPNHAAGEVSLPDARGTFMLKFLATNDTFLTYEVNVTNRKFSKKENITLNGKIYERYIHSYDFVQKSFLRNGALYFQHQDKVEETYLIGYGLVNQKRLGTITPVNVEGAQVVEHKLISELLQIR